MLAMPLGYQERDHDIVDYQQYRLLPTFRARGPAPRSFDRGQFFACIGAAQTFGCFCDSPYPALLQQQIGIDALNLGCAGAGPTFFLNQPRLIELANRAKFVIIQVMSGRSEDNSCFRSDGLEWLYRRDDGVGLSAEIAYRELLARHDEDFVRRIVAETRSNWVSSFTSLLQKIEPPKILFWFSQRQTDYSERFDAVHRLFDEFPQLVNASMVDAIKPYVNEYVECISRRGMPQQLMNRFTGEPAVVDFTRSGEESYADSYNSYYPSPEMQVDAADALHDACLHVSQSDWAFKPGTSHPDSGRVTVETEQALEPLKHSLFARLRGIDSLAFAGDRRMIAWLQQYFDASDAPSDHQYICIDDHLRSDWDRAVRERRRVIVSSIADEDSVSRDVAREAYDGGITTPVLRLFADVFVNLACDDEPLHDAQEPQAISSMKYAIIGTPRSGTEFLCKVLTSTGEAGFPEEHLRLESQLLTRYCGFDCTRYLRMLMARRTTPNGVFGTKIISHFLHEHLSRSPALKRDLSQFRFVQVVRRDRVAQAISALLASKTGIWHVRNDSEKENYERALSKVAITDLDLQWVRWLSDGFDRENRHLTEFVVRHRLQSITVTYEDVVTNPAVHLKPVASFLGIGSEGLDSFVALKPTRSVLSESILAQYRESKYSGKRQSVRSLFRAFRLWRQRTPIQIGATSAEHVQRD